MILRTTNNTGLFIFSILDFHVKRFPILIATLLLALMTVLCGGTARRESIAFDEVAHIGAGVSYLQKLDMRMNPEHPPLAKIVAAIPLVARGVHADYSDVSWSVRNLAGRGAGCCAWLRTRLLRRFWCSAHWC